eukprot:CAMPEP_0117451102 /NCGR_PEP_ID=MMETSP0759-20121206/8824_1 /TAXON_ID=63605 /ORGANISM="Percolomonas cosmopolitus, Strain WS" /LENGTH=1024 /DNA_ID=CAMNT_0005243671 /DNA_START=3 /DNA_END=3077 /DNA_ORIENTATION=+
MTEMTEKLHSMDLSADADNLFDRVERVLGAEAMKRMRNAKVLIVGLGGLGVEVAKNIILTGVGVVTLADSKVTTYNDLSSQFYLTESSIGKNRVEASLHHLKELNPSFVKIDVLQGGEAAITDDVIKQHSVVIFTDHHIKDLVSINEMCRKHGTKFIATECRGVFGALFCDFGENFTIYDDNGEEPETNMVTHISNDEFGTVTVHDAKINHGLGDGDVVRFAGVEGMTELNSTEEHPKLFKVKVTGKHEFTIGDTRSFGTYKQGGYAYQVKQPQNRSYKSLSESIKTPEIIDYDFGKLERPHQLHKLFQALSDYVKQNGGKFPRPHNEEDAQNLFKLAQTNYDKDVDEKLALNFAKTAQGNLNPIVTVFGGFAAQEVMKACSGKFTPLNQWFYFDSLETLPEDGVQESDAQPLQSRYDGQIAVYGRKFQEQLQKLHVFMVGVGALGCEYLKNFAMLGLGTAQGGKVTITDLDSIEMSNLSRQFLFRRRHIGKMKSTCGAEAAQEMNSAMNVVALQEKVGPETEETFHDAFWESLTLVTNALDNIHARMYVDQRCVFYHKPLLEAGTLGPKGNTQVVVPNLTESYSSSRDPPEKEIPICTLKNFPNQIEHTIQWARDKFEEFFAKVPTETNNYIKSADFVQQLDENPATKLVTLKGIHDSLISHKPTSFEECVQWARLKFEELFNNQIQQLLFNFPLDMTTSSGTPFWGGAKKPPTPIKFDPENELHMGFISAAANLRAVVYGLKGRDPKDVDTFRKAVNHTNVPDFKPQEGVKIAVSESEAKEEDVDGMSVDATADELVAQLPKPSSIVGYQLNPVDFEKDDDTNFHIDFITACSNLRAGNYKIPPADRKKTKGIAGKIMPAMVTTTALITGLGTLELYKLVQKKQKLEDYKNSFVNIALPFCVQSDPVAPATTDFRGEKWTLWDRFEVAEGRDITMREFFEIFQKKHKLEITMMSSGVSVIYSFFGDKKKIAERMEMPLKKVVEQISGDTVPATKKYLTFEICCTDVDTDEDVDVPFVLYKYQ